jgi:hypothetical protein
VFYLILGLIAIGIVSTQIGSYYNETSFSAGSNFYNLTLYLTRGNIDAKFYPSFNEHFVTGINGVKNQGQIYWTLWILCQKQNAWVVSPVGADLIRLANGQTLAWAYEVPYTAPVTGARTVPERCLFITRNAKADAAGSLERSGTIRSLFGGYSIASASRCNHA